MPFFKSRKFWLLVADAVFSLATYFVGKYAGASSQDILTVLGVLQPVWIAVIVGIGALFGILIFIAWKWDRSRHEQDAPPPAAQDRQRIGSPAAR